MRKRKGRSTNIILFIIILFIFAMIMAAKYKNQYNIEPITSKHSYKQFQMFDENVGWALTDENEVLYTTTGYENFYTIRKVESVDVVTNNYMYADFVDENTAYIVYFSETGTKIIVEYTLNAGKSWHHTSIEHGDYGKAYSVYVDLVDKKDGYLLYCSKAEAGKFNKTLYVTNDGGASFKSVCSLTSSISGEPTGISFVTADKGYIATKGSKSENYLYQTYDAGMIWRTQGLLDDAEIYDHTDIYTPFFCGAEKKVGKIILKQAGKYSAQFVLMSTRNSGRVWIKEKILDFEDIKSFSFIDSSQGFIVDQDGKVHKITKNSLMDFIK